MVDLNPLEYTNFQEGIIKILGVITCTVLLLNFYQKS